jgi:pimeloyl-ACP methyl ester carboxylesterase
MPALILIPGLLCNELLWSSQIEVLRGSAEISVADITAQATISEMAASVLGSAPERFSLAGFSLGSQVALAIMEQARDRVDRLALLSATHCGLSRLAEGALQQRVATLDTRNFDRYLDQAYPTYVAPSRAGDTELKRIFVEMAHAIGVEAGRRQMEALLGITQPFANLGLIRCPTILIGGREDHRTPPAAHELLAREIPGSELVIIEDSGHFTSIEKPVEVSVALRRWLEA